MDLVARADYACIYGLLRGVSFSLVLEAGIYEISPLI